MRRNIHDHTALTKNSFDCNNLHDDIMANASMTMTLKITRAEPAADGIQLFELRHPDSNDLPEFSAGAHISITVPNGAIRKYSLCNDPNERDRYVIAVKREIDGRGGSVSLIDGVKAGDSVAASDPVNDFELPRNVNDFVFIAGGIGITPIMAMIHQLRATEGKKFRLYYCTRSPETTAFVDELKGPEFRGKVTIHHDGGNPDKALDLWPILEQRKNLEHIFCCGPRPLMQAVRDMAGHWPASALHFEAFSEPERTRIDDKPFKLRLARSGDVVDVPVGTTILEALRAKGYDAPSSCESGTCGTCRTQLLAGEADHRDLVLIEAERSNNIMICVSRALSSEITIDR